MSLSSSPSTASPSSIRSSSRYNSENKQLNELSRRGLVMKSPFFQMATGTTSTASSAAQSPPQRKTSLAEIKRINTNPSIRSVSTTIIPTSTVRPSPSEQSLSSRLNSYRTSVQVEQSGPGVSTMSRTVDLDSEKKGLALKLPAASFAFEDDRIQRSFDKSADKKIKKLDSTDVSPRTGMIPDTVKSEIPERSPEVVVYHSPPQSNDNREDNDEESLATIGSSMRVTDDTIESPDLQFIHRRLDSLDLDFTTPEIIDPHLTPTVNNNSTHNDSSSSRTPTVETFQKTNLQPSALPKVQDMSRQSVLDQFDKDIRELLMLEQKSTGLFVDDIDDAIAESVLELDFDESPKAGNTSPQKTNSLVSNLSVRRNSRSTLSSYGGGEVTEYEPEHEARASPPPLRMHPPSSKPPPPPLSPKRIYQNKMQEMLASQQAELNRARSLKNATSSRPTARASTSTITADELTSINDAAKPRRGKLSLRRKSAATLRLSTLSSGGAAGAAATQAAPSFFRQSPTENHHPPTPSMHMLTIAFHPFLKSLSIRKASPAQVPSDPEMVALWFLRQVLSSKANPAGAFLSARIYIPSDLWQLDTLPPSVLEPRLRCLAQLTRLGADFASITPSKLDRSLVEFDTIFQSAFSIPLSDTSLGTSSPRRLSSRRSSTASTALGLTPVASHASGSTSPTYTSSSNGHSTPWMASSRSSSMSGPSSASSSTGGGGMFKRLRKKSIVVMSGGGGGGSRDDNHTTPAPHEPPHVSSMLHNEQKLNLDHYLSAISSLAASLESVQQRSSENRDSEEWVGKYRRFVAHVVCRLVLKDLIALQDIYKHDFREYLLH